MRSRISGDIAAQARFEIVGPHTPVDFQSITAVGVFPFTVSGDIVTIQNSRGIDIPGGHVERGESSIEEVARREAMEEAGIALSNLKLIAYLRSSVLHSSGSPTYIAVLTARAELLTEHTASRTIMSVNEFLRRYSAGDPSIMRDLLELIRAQRVQWVHP